MDKRTHDRLIDAVVKWSKARRAVLGTSVVTPDAYDKLARAEADLQKEAEKIKEPGT